MGCIQVVTLWLTWTWMPTNDLGRREASAVVFIVSRSPSHGLMVNSCHMCVSVQKQTMQAPCLVSRPL